MVNTRSFLLNEQNVELFPKLCGDGNCSGNTYLVIVEGPCKMNVVPVVTTPEYIKDSDLLKVTRNKHLSFSVIFRNIVTLTKRSDFVAFFVDAKNIILWLT